LLERVDSNSPSGQSRQNGFIALLAKCTRLIAAVLMRVHTARFFVIPSGVEESRGTTQRWIHWISRLRFAPLGKTV